MSSPPTSIHNTWRIRGVVQDYLIVRASHAAELTEEPILPVFLEASLNQWLASLYTRRIVHELYELVEGPLAPAAPHSRHRVDEQLKRRLREAFRQGELVAYANGPIRRKQSIGGGTGGGGGGAPMPVPLLADKPEQAPPAPEQEKPQEQTERTWVDILLVDEDDTPLAGVRYRLTLPDGSTREGQLDDEGAAREEDIDPGQCVLVFPELDDEDA